MKMKTLTEKRFFEWHEDKISVTLRNKGGSYGGGSEVIIICDSSRLLQPEPDRGCDDADMRITERSRPSAVRD